VRVRCVLRRARAHGSEERGVLPGVPEPRSDAPGCRSGPDARAHREGGRVGPRREIENLARVSGPRRSATQHDGWALPAEAERPRMDREDHVMQNNAQSLDLEGLEGRIQQATELILKLKTERDEYKDSLRQTEIRLGQTESSLRQAENEIES